MKCIRSKQQRQTAFSDLPFFRFLKTLCVLSLFCFELSQIKDTNINHSKSAALGIKLMCIHKLSLDLFLPPISSVFLSLHFSVSLATKARQYVVCLCIQDEGFSLPLLPNADVAAQNKCSRWKTHRKPAHAMEFLFCCWLQKFMNIRNTEHLTAYRKAAVTGTVSLGMSCITTIVLNGSDLKQPIIVNHSVLNVPTFP